MAEPDPVSEHSSDTFHSFSRFFLHDHPFCSALALLLLIRLFSKLLLFFLPLLLSTSLCALALLRLVRLLQRNSAKNPVPEAPEIPCLSEPELFKTRKTSTSTYTVKTVEEVCTLAVAHVQKVAESRIAQECGRRLREISVSLSELVGCIVDEACTRLAEVDGRGMAARAARTVRDMAGADDNGLLLASLRSFLDELFRDDPDDEE